jgi:hypothetical protein
LRSPVLVSQCPSRSISARYTPIDRFPLIFRVEATAERLIAKPPPPAVLRQIEQ